MPSNDSGLASAPVAADVFHLHEGLHAEAGALAAEAGLLEAAEGDRRAGDLGAVDRDHAELQRAGHAVDAARVLRVQVGDEAVLGGVGAGDGLGLACRRAARAATGPKVSSCMIARVGGDVGEDGRGVEVRAEVEARAAGEEARALGEGVGDLGLLLGDGAAR